MAGPEAIIERDNAEYAREGLGLITLKLALFGTVGWPDRLFLAPGGRVLFVEYKAPGKKLQPHQLKVHQLLKRYGFNVYTVDQIQTGRELLKCFAENKDLPECVPGEHARETHFKLEGRPATQGKKTKRPKHDTGGGPCYCSRSPGVDS